MKKSKRTYARSPRPLPSPPPARLSALLSPARLLLLLGADLCLDSLLWPPFPHTRHSVRGTGPLQALLLVSPFLQPGPLEPRRPRPLHLPAPAAFLFRGPHRRRR